jgi:Tubulin like
VLPSAFANVLEADKFELSQANGYGALRELDRLVNAHETVHVSWEPGKEVRLDGAAADHVYLIDGSRDLAEGVQLDHEDHPEDTFPVAIADAIYMHIFPSSAETLLRDYPNLQGALISGQHNRYSTFGTYVIRYDWERLVRSLTARAAREVLLSWVQASSINGLELAQKFLAGHARDTFTNDGQYQELPLLLTEALTSPDAATGGLDPVSRWLEPASGSAPFPETPDLHSQFSDLKKMVVRWVTRYDNQQVINDVAGDSGYLKAFWGEQFGRYTPGLAEPQFYPVGNANAKLCEEQFAKSVYLAAAEVMNLNQGAGGLNAASDFVTAIDNVLQRYSQLLDGTQLPDLAPYHSRVQDAKEALLETGKWDDGKDQHIYLEAEQDLLHELRRSECLARAQTLLGRFRFVVGHLKEDLVGWQTTVQHLATEAERERLAVDNARTAADASKLRRMTPLPGSPIEGDLYQECAGQESGDGGLAENLLKAMAARQWRVHMHRNGSQRIVWVGQSVTAKPDGEPTPTELSDVTGQLTHVFLPLRQRHVFEILARSGEQALAVATELKQGSARLAAFDASQQLQYTPKNVAVQDWSYFFANWRTQGPGSELATDVRRLLDDAASANVPKPCSEIGGPALSTELPSMDKIVAFSARHLILLDAFKGVSILRSAYEDRRSANPSPHVLPEEKGAARMEAASHELAKQGLLKAPVERIAPSVVALCTDSNFLQRFATLVAMDMIRHNVTDDIDKIGSWVIQHPEGQSIELGPEWALVDVIKRVASGEDHASRAARDAVRTAQMRVNKDGHSTEALKKFALNGSTALNLPKEVDAVLRVVAAMRVSSTGAIS